ncbi:MAG: HlyD family efflux transporter periplasmic adaptor subunit [Chitinophagaceae bacterium]|jgi:multidrug resistance efflux pump|nr:HlyD family efflux transporter periplasmic adaptor subunit [Chitinophagaceae bacterium]MCA6512903.1 HlyD family efflux transporter periplasmic adaptor subunit [Chitinophagaceae bacterium]
MENKKTKENLRSEEINEIIGQVPSWIIMRGNLIIGLIILLLLSGAAILKYPEIISAPVIISSSSPPIKLFAQSSGLITEMNAIDGDMIKQGKIIAIVDNAAVTSDMLALKKLIESIDTAIDIKKIVAALPMAKHIQVGQIQSNYATLYASVDNYIFLLKNPYYDRNISSIKKQEKYNLDIEKSIKIKEKMLAEQLAVEAWKDSVNLILLKDKVISLNEYNNIRKGYISQNLNSNEINNTILQNKQQLQELQKNANEIQLQFKTNEQDALSTIKLMAKKIKGEIELWEKQYVIKSPIEGKLVFFKIRRQNQYVSAGTPLFLVVPTSQDIEIRIQLPLNKAGKVKVGQTVYIKLNEFPFEEFGKIQAKVIGISNVFLDSSYSVELKLINGLKTTRNKLIEFRPQITGEAEIVTNNMTILQRMLNGLIGKLENY